jgi:hypothetical protein
MNSRHLDETQETQGIITASEKIWVSDQQVLFRAFLSTPSKSLNFEAE